MNSYLSNLALRGAGLTSSMLTSQPRLDYPLEPLTKIAETAGVTSELASTDDANQGNYSANQSRSDQRPSTSAPSKRIEPFLLQEDQTISPPAIAKETRPLTGMQPSVTVHSRQFERAVSVTRPSDPRQNNPAQGPLQTDDSPQSHVGQLAVNRSDVSQTAKQAPVLYIVEPQHEKTEPFIAPRPVAGNFDGHANGQIERSIHVHIGTIEVHAVIPRPPQPLRELTAHRPILSLDEYLRRRNEGKI
jgi:hypothetical protein